MKPQTSTSNLDITLAQLGQSDDTQYEQIFVQWYEALCRYAYSIVRNMEESEDIVQKTFCKLWDKKNELQIHTSTKSYLYRMVHNESLNFVKKRKEHDQHALNYQQLLEHYSRHTAEQVIFKELESRIAEALQELPPQCRRVFELSRLDQLPYKEIAEQLSISVNTVENHLAKALRLMRISLKDYLPFLFLSLF